MKAHAPNHLHKTSSSLLNGCPFKKSKESRVPWVLSSGSQDVFLLKRNPKACNIVWTRLDCVAMRNPTVHPFAVECCGMLWNAVDDSRVPASKNCDGVQSKGAWLVRRRLPMSFHEFQWNSCVLLCQAREGVSQTSLKCLTENRLTIYNTNDGMTALLQCTAPANVLEWFFETATWPHLSPKPRIGRLSTAQHSAAVYLFNLCHLCLFRILYILSRRDMPSTALARYYSTILYYHGLTCQTPF